MSLSAKNGWLDEQGRVYIIYTVREVQESLCCAEHKAVKLFRELEQADLIERKRRGLGRPSLIYVKNFSSGLPKAQVQNCANSNSCAAENAVQVQPKPQSNKTDKNKTERNNPFLPDESDREQLEDYFYQALEVELLLRLCPDDEDTIYQIVDLLVDTCSTKRKMLRIAGDDKPTEVVRSRLKKAERRPYPLRARLSGREHFPSAKHEAIFVGSTVQCAHDHESLLSEQNEPRLCAWLSESGVMLSQRKLPQSPS